jgi:hypothetical protein
MNDCKLTPFLYALDNRFSNTVFLVGTISNVGTQIATTIGYYVASQQLSGDMATTFEDLYENTSMYKLVENFYAYFSADEYEDLGTLLTSFVLSIVQYKSPNSVVGRDTSS